MGVPGQPDEVGGDPARLEPLELLDEHARVDDAAGADHAFLAPEDPRGHVPELVGLAVGDDRVPGVRPAVVAADEIRVAGEQVDDLALALVAPLGADDHGRGHEPSIGPPHGSLPPRGSRGRALLGRKPMPLRQRWRSGSLRRLRHDRQRPDAREEGARGGTRGSPARLSGLPPLSAGRCGGRGCGGRGSRW